MVVSGASPDFGMVIFHSAGGVDTASCTECRRAGWEPAGLPVPHRGPRKVSSAAQALWMTSPTCPPKPRRRRKGGNFSSRMKQSSLAGHEYGEAARNAGERGPRKVPEAFAQQKSRGPWPKGGNFSGKGDRNPPKHKNALPSPVYREQSVRVKRAVGAGIASGNA